MPALALVAIVAIVAAGCAGGTTETVTTTVPAGTGTSGGLAPPPERAYYGHIDSLEQAGGRWELRFDPAWFLSGETANRAAAEDGAVEPGEPVPNDNYVVEEGHRLLTFFVADNADVRVLTRQGDQLGPTEVSVDDLAAIVAGTSDIELFETLQSGVWIGVDNDTVRTIEQQYRP